MEKRVTHILVFPFPIQGHINPMLQFSKRLASEGLEVTVILASSRPLHQAMELSSIHVERISDCFHDNKTLKYDEDLEFFRQHVSRTLAYFLEEKKLSEHPPKVLIYDSVMPWALDIAQASGLNVAAFFTQPWAVNAIYYHLHLGNACNVPVEEQERPMLHSFPSLPLMTTKDLPSLLYDSSSYPDLFDLLMSQFENCNRANWLLCNTFDKLEEKVLKWIESKWHVKNIGPTIPSMFLHKHLQHDKDYGISLFTPEVRACKEWLDSKQPCSTVYVSFGSVAELQEDQMKELALGLKLSESFFLWTVRASEMNKLPIDYPKVSTKGLIVKWCPQIEVLAHKATGCFMTHCGWNSSLEALSLGVPMVAMPQWSDQPTNAKFITEVWEVGIKVRVEKDGFASKEEIARCIKEIMIGEKGKKIRINSIKWKELAKEAVSEGGSSNKNINDLVANLENH